MWREAQPAVIHKEAKNLELLGSAAAYSSVFTQSGLEMKRAAECKVWQQTGRLGKGGSCVSFLTNSVRLHCRAQLAVCICESARCTCGWLVELRMRAHSSARSPVGQPCRLYCCAAALSCSCTTTPSQRRDNKVNTRFFSAKCACFPLLTAGPGQSNPELTH